MPVIAVVGAQWGGEGKGHVADLLAARARMVVRYSGGASNGHTVVNERGAFKLHLVPTGIFSPSTVNIIGSGVIIEPAALLAEIADLRAHGINVAKLLISDRAHVIMPYHVLQEQYEDHQGMNYASSTARRGASSAYADKVAQIGIRVGDLLHEEVLLSSLRQVLDKKNKILTKVYGAPPLSLHEVYLQYLDYGRQLAEMVTDTYPIIQRAIDRDYPILLEGAQGALVDLDYGIYPYAGFALPGAAGASQSAGIGPNRIQSVVGVFKAYTTRVDQGPFATEITGPIAHVFRQPGVGWAEIQVQTGRPRRIGWFDGIMARYAAQINGIDTVAITKLDMLDSLPTIKVCIGYRLHDAELDFPPSNLAMLAKVEPIYEEMPGWLTPTSTARRFDQLPENARMYLARVSEVIGAQLGYVSVGPERSQVIEVSRII